MSDKIARAMAQKNASQLSDKANKTYVDGLVSGINASPKGVYATLSALQSAFPTGNTNVYLVTTDGGWYYWNGSAWTKGGTYQSTGIADKAILKTMLSDTVTDGTDLLVSGINLADIFNTSNCTNSTWVGVSGTDANCTFSTDIINGKYRYKIDTASGFVVPTSKPTLYFKNNIFNISKDARLVVKNTSSKKGSIVVELYDTFNTKINTLYLSVTASTGEQISTLPIIKGTATYIKVVSFTWTDVTDGVNYAYVYGFDVYYPDEERTSLKAKIGNINNLNSQILTLNNNSYGTTKIKKENNRLINNKGNVIHTFTSYDTITKGIATTGSMTGMNTESPLKLTVDSTGYCTFVKNVSLTFKANNIYGLWVWCDRETISNAYNIDIYADATLTFSLHYNNFNYQNGWNYITFIPASDITCTSLQVQYRVTDYTINTPFYIDSIVENRNLKACILLGMDNCHTNLYTNIYPLLQAREFIGTFAWQHGHYPGESGYLTQAQFDELMANGWDYSMYGYIGTWASDITDWNQYNTMYTALKAYLNLLKSYNISTPVAYFCPNNASSSPLIKALRLLGFKLLRNHESQELIAHYDIDCFETSCFQIQDINDSLTKAKANIDKAIQTGQCLNIFCHDVVTDIDNTGLNVSSATYTQLLDYIKTKVNAGLCEVITYKEFYERYYDSSRNISDVDFQRLIDRIAKLESI